MTRNVLLAAVFCAQAARAWSQDPVPLGSYEHPGNGDPRYSICAGAAGDGFLMVGPGWSGSPPKAAILGVGIAIVDGVPTPGTPFVIALLAGSTPTAPVAASIPVGGASRYFVAWRDSTSNIHTAVIRPDGTAIRAAQLHLNDTSSGTLARLSAVAEGDSFALGLTIVTQHRVFLNRFSNAGIPMNGAVIIPSSGNVCDGPGVSHLPGTPGRTLVTFSQGANGQFAIIDAGSVSSVVARYLGEQLIVYVPAVAANLADQEWMVAWQDNLGRNIKVRRIGAAGDFRGDVRLLEYVGGSGSLEEHRLVWNPLANLYHAIWMSTDPETGATSIRHTRVKGGTGVILDRSVLRADPDHNPTCPRMAIRPQSPDLLAAWGYPTETAREGAIDGVLLDSTASPVAPVLLRQYGPDGAAVVPQGGVNRHARAVLKARVFPVGATTGIDVEVKPAGEPFTGSPTASSERVDAAGMVAVTFDSPADGGYHWQARATDVNGHSTAWVSCGTNPEDDAEVDFMTRVNVAPAAVTVLQVDPRNGATIPTGGRFVDARSVRFEAVIADADDSIAAIELEIRSLGTEFSEAPTHRGGFVTHPARVGLEVELPAGSYRWRLRPVDPLGAVGAWVGPGGSPDFQMVTYGSSGAARCGQSAGSGFGWMLLSSVTLALVAVRR